MASAALPLTTVAVLDTPVSLSFAAGTEPAEIRRATIADAPAIHALINANLAAGHLLPRTAEDVTRRAARFLVVTVNDAVVGCAVGASILGAALGAVYKPVPKAKPTFAQVVPASRPAVLVQVGGATVRVEAGFDAALLGQVVAALDRRNG